MKTEKEKIILEFGKNFIKSQININDDIELAEAANKAINQLISELPNLSKEKIKLNNKDDLKELY